VALSWREKYLQALAEHESDEQRFKNQIAQLRKGLQGLAEAALGIDPELDELLAELVSEGSNKSRPVGIKDLQTLASTAVSRRATRQSVSADSLHAVVDGLLALNPDRGTQSKLKKYRKLVERRCANLHAYPQLLSEASDLMAATLDDILDYKPGWLAKKLGVPAQVKSQEDHAVETSADEATAEQPAQEEP
jgi:hypothetical protein